MFVPGSLAVGPSPARRDRQLEPNGGTNGAGLLDIGNIDVPANSQVQVQFDITLAAGLANGTVILNQSDLLRRSAVKIADSDDPNINGQADPTVAGDEDPTRVVIGVPPPSALEKANTQATAAVGETFRYRITVPSDAVHLPDVRRADHRRSHRLRRRPLVRLGREDRGLGRVDAREHGHRDQPRDRGSRDRDRHPGRRAGHGRDHRAAARHADQRGGLQFTNTADYTFNLINGSPVSQRPGRPGTTPPMTIVGPDVLTLEKSGPATMAPGTPATFTLDVRNAGTGPAWNLSVLDRLPERGHGRHVRRGAHRDHRARVPGRRHRRRSRARSCRAPTYTALFAGDPTCELTLTMLSAAAVVGPDQRLIVTYQTQLDADSQNAAALTNVAGATQWFSAAASSPSRRTFTRTLTNGTVGTLDHEDAHTVTVGVPAFLFEKTVMDVTTGANPATTANPGDRLRYSVRIVNQSAATLTNLGIYDEIDALNNPDAAFQPGTLALITVPAGADASNTSATGGAKGTGVVDVRNLSAAPGATVLVEFEITLESVIGNGTLVTNQSALRVNGTPLSDDPNVNGPSDPFNPNDQDPTVVRIVSGPQLRVQKISTDLTGDPNVLLPGDTLRYTITVKNIGAEDVTDAMFRDSVPANTRYVAGTTTLNGTAVPDGPGGSSPLSAGIPIYAPGDPVPGVLRADPAPAANNVATIVFDVVIDAGVIDGTVISNQAFVAATNVVPEQPSDDPATVIPDDPTRDVVGNEPLLFAPKSAALSVDNNSNGFIDPGDVIHYTITIYNQSAVPATGVVLTDSVPANTTYVAGSTTLNNIAVPDGPGGSSPLAAGIPISSSDLTPPLPGPGAARFRRARARCSSSTSG